MATRTQSSNDGEDNNNEDYFLPPQSQRPFNSSIKRKRVTFVPASTSLESTLPQPQPQSQPSNAGAKYLAIVLPKTSTLPPPPLTNPTSASTQETPNTTITTTASPSEPQPPNPPRCPICKHPTPNPTSKHHTSTIAHQLSLTHSHPPSHLDRDRKGLKYLEGYGWDPDSRLGLGARSEGIRIPIKAKEKRDTTGLGLFSNLEDDDEDHRAKKKVVVRKDEEQRVVRGTLNVKQVRKLEEEKKKKAEKLRKTFYGEDLSRYLGPDG